VQSLDQSAAVSFVLTETIGTEANARTQNYWIVDLWKSEEGQWKLLARYQSEVRIDLPLNRRPTGKQ
jgi:hypothetical protein